MAEYALVKDGVVVNTIVAEDENWVDTYAAGLGVTAIDVDGLDVHPGIDWYYDGTTFTPPVPAPTLTAQPTEIPPDSTTTAMVTYTNLGDAPAQVTFVINSNLVQTVAVVAGVASIPVAASTPNDTVTVTCEGMSVVIGVTA